MFKLTAAIRSHFVISPYLEGRIASRRSSKATSAPAMESDRAIWRSAEVVVPRPADASNSRLHPDEIRKGYPSAPTRSLVPDSRFAALACKAPAVCSELKQMNEREARAVTIGRAA